MSLEKHRISTQKITLGLSVHRPEMIPYMADWMRRHDAIFLEEPPAAGFAQMLTGELAVNDYLRELDVEYPAIIEAGVIHYPLWRLLRRRVPPYHRVQLIFIADAALHTLGKKGHLFGPGDLLTLMYIFHPTVAQPKREALLAARSLIYSKLVAKEELTENLNSLPHLNDELACIQIARRLSTADCRRLFPLVCGATSSDARQIVAEYLAE